MTLPHALTGLGAIAGDYDILLCDVWGVIHNGRESWPDACQALARFNREPGPNGPRHVVLISNSPRPAPGGMAASCRGPMRSAANRCRRATRGWNG